MVVGRSELDILGQSLLQRLYALSNALRHLYRVGITLFVDGQLNRFAPVDPRDCFALFETAFDDRLVAKIDRTLGHIGDNRVAKLVDRLELV